MISHLSCWMVFLRSSIASLRSFAQSCGSCPTLRGFEISAWGVFVTKCTNKVIRSGQYVNKYASKACLSSVGLTLAIDVIRFFMLNVRRPVWRSCTIWVFGPFLILRAGAVVRISALLLRLDSFDPCFGKGTTHDLLNGLEGILIPSFYLFPVPQPQFNNLPGI